jgi:VanZ family protein
VKLIKLWLPVVVWAGLIFYFSSVPNFKTGLAYDFLLRKIAHVIEYFIFTFLLYRAFNGSFKMDPVQLLMYPAGLALFYAATDEMHQYFVAGRGCSIVDCLIDALGIIGWLALIKFQPKIAVKLSKF